MASMDIFTLQVLFGYHLVLLRHTSVLALKFRVKILRRHFLQFEFPRGLFVVAHLLNVVQVLSV